MADDQIVVWSANLVPVTVILEAQPDGFAGARGLGLTASGKMIAEHDAPDGRHLVIGDARGEHRLWLRNPTPGQSLAAVIPLDRDFAIRIASLLRFHRHLFGRDAGPPPRGWLLTPYRRARLQQMLVALDMRLAGATYREIAAALGETDAATMTAAEWKGSRARSFAIRIVRAAIAMMNGGYRKLLRIR